MREFSRLEAEASGRFARFRFLGLAFAFAFAAQLLERFVEANLRFALLRQLEAQGRGGACSEQFAQAALNVAAGMLNGRQGEFLLGVRARLLQVFREIRDVFGNLLLAFRDLVLRLF